MNAAFYPVDFPPERLAATIGLLSDTHLPDRRRALPPVLSTIFEGVDLLLHAGDVGELRVLDELSRIAPVIAVHGNDDTAEAQQELPERQLLSVAGRRLLLWHSHHPDRASELELRKDDAWAPKLERVRERGRQAGATLVVFGHIHVPLQQEEDGILLINPGALASGNYFTRQRLQTVALLFVRDDGGAAVRHVDVSVPDRSFVPTVDWASGFGRALSGVSETILAPDLAPFVAAIADREFADRDAVKRAYVRLAHRCWEGKQESVTRSEVLAALTTDPAITPGDREKISTLLRV